MKKFRLAIEVQYSDNEGSTNDLDEQEIMDRFFTGLEMARANGMLTPEDPDVCCDWISVDDIKPVEPGCTPHAEVS